MYRFQVFTNFEIEFFLTIATSKDRVIWVTWPIWVFGAGGIIWQLSRGIVLDRSWKPKYRRSENPVAFWIGIAFQSLLILVGVIICVCARQ